MKNRILVAILPVLACFALLPGARAQCLDGCDSTNFNTFQGDGALINNTIGSGNAAFGWRALFLNTDGSFNTGVGAGALVLNTGSDNTAVGTAALLLNTTGADNVAVGTDALLFNDSGHDLERNSAPLRRGLKLDYFHHSNNLCLKRGTAPR